MKLTIIYIALLCSLLGGCVKEKGKIIINAKVQEDYISDERHLDGYIESGVTPDKKSPRYYKQQLYWKKSNLNWVPFYRESSGGTLVFDEMESGKYEFDNSTTSKIIGYGSSSLYKMALDGGERKEDLNVPSDFSFELAPGERKVLNVVFKNSEFATSFVKITEIKDIQHDKVTIVGDLAYLHTENGITDNKTKVGFIFNDTQNVFKMNKNLLGTFEATITNLEPNKEYTVHPYGYSYNIIYYGEKVKFTTKKEPFPISSSLVAYYTFDNADCNDYWGNIDYHGILQGVGEPPTFVTNTPSGSGKAMKCTGEKFFRLVKNPLSFGSKKDKDSDYAISVWVNTKSSRGEVLKKEGDNYSCSSLSFASNKISGFNLDYTSILFDGNWHHIVLVYGKEDTLLYIDGEFMEKGRRCYHAGVINVIGQNYAGLMDNLRFYTRKLSETEIRKLYHSKM